ncbi:MAG: DUF2062 domain-containing protein [Candidatus Omnitrophica bacterium]|nr:DUF2062 domain-containing protein [Candidatus Omnitrophota bacterium]
MQKRPLWIRIKRAARLIYLRLFRINDSPAKIAGGFGIGVFIGATAGVGPIIAVFLAYIFRVNRVSALLGSLLFNTWVSVVTLLASIKVGSWVMGVDQENVFKAWNALTADFKWSKFFQASFSDVIIPVVVGNLIISFFIAVFMSGVVYFAAVEIRKIKHEAKMKKHALRQA